MNIDGYSHDAESTSTMDLNLPKWPDHNLSGPPAESKTETLDGYSSELLKEAIDKVEKNPNLVSTRLEPKKLHRMNQTFYEKGKAVLEARIELATIKLKAQPSTANKIALAEAKLKLEEFEMEYNFPGIIFNGYFFKK